MRYEGIVSHWNDERGFGFVKPFGKDDVEVFVHISAFPKDGRRPVVGERVSFEVVVGEKGKKKATNVFCPDRPKAEYRKLENQPHARKRSKTKKSTSWLGGVLSAGLLVIGAAVAYQYVQQDRSESQRRRELSQMPSSTPVQTQSSVFKCDGRIHCSQMTSCEEAMFFLNNCPGTKMDGDGNGIPCEVQWCGDRGISGGRRIRW